MTEGSQRELDRIRKTVGKVPQRIQGIKNRRK